MLDAELSYQPACSDRFEFAEEEGIAPVEIENVPASAKVSQAERR